MTLTVVLHSYLYPRRGGVQICWELSALILRYLYWALPSRER